MVTVKKSTEKTVEPEKGQALYRALVPCRVGSYREAGEVFSFDRFAECPRHLEEVTDLSAAETMQTRAEDAAPEVPGPTPAEMFGTE